MAKIVLHKTNVGEIRKDDIVGIYRSNHKFSSYEQDQFRVLNCPGMRTRDIRSYLKMKFPTTLPMWFTNTIGWTFDKPLRRAIWRDGDNYKIIKNDTGGLMTARFLNVGDFVVLKSSESTEDQIKMVLDKITYTVTLHPNNQEVVNI